MANSPQEGILYLNSPLKLAEMHVLSGGLMAYFPAKHRNALAYLAKTLFMCFYSQIFNFPCMKTDIKT